MEAAIRAKAEKPDFAHGKVSLWVKLVRLDAQGHEEPVGPLHKVMLTATSYDDLIRQLAENLVVATFGGDVQLVDAMPNLILKLFETKRYVAIPGAPPIDQAGQLFLKGTIYRSEPSLWDQWFGKKS
ncbi:MAG TPA: hypothetical protein VNT75_00385 [Symbiobacteriaceae bacterium]|nr:hypothetical protein [Symbiobacteriaceae bacterium]